MSICEDHSIESRIREILATVPDDGHHFGRPFLSAYQIAIAFDQRFPRAAALIGKPVGGKDTGRHDSLASTCNQLSRHIPRRHPVRHRGALSQRAVPQISGVRQRRGDGRLLPWPVGHVDLPAFAVLKGVGAEADPQVSTTVRAPAGSTALYSPLPTGYEGFHRAPAAANRVRVGSVSAIRLTIASACALRAWRIRHPNKKELGLNPHHHQTRSGFSIQRGSASLKWV